MFRVGAPSRCPQVLPRAAATWASRSSTSGPTSIERSDGAPAWIYDFGLRYDGRRGDGGDAEDVREPFQDAFAAVWAGEAESDGFNALVLRAGLTWRQAMVLRAYAKYLRQAGSTFSQDYIEQCLVANVAHRAAARAAVRGPASTRRSPATRDELDRRRSSRRSRGALDEVASLDQDRILRSYLGADPGDPAHQLLPARRRRPAASRTSRSSSTRSAVPDLPAAAARRSRSGSTRPRVEGVHLRFGAVARGGLRWSDRREDFRTEVLGLVKAQMVKNAVIVPVGAKGGFVVKQPRPDAGRPRGRAGRGHRLLPDVHLRRCSTSPTTCVDGAGRAAAATSCATTATTPTSSSPPTRAPRRSPTSPTSVSADYGFWLGDAFASGGSAGYDHKAMGITARGAWESVKRHFRELGVDTQTEDFTVVGVGDMSGDVFGNGMLLSEHIRLVAAFDHRHVFLDPDPDAAASFAERARLFDAAALVLGRLRPRADLRGRRRLPAHGEVDPAVTPQVRAALGIDGTVAHDDARTS